jgi:hypothetical protein
MNAIESPLPEDARLVQLRDAASAVGCCDRTLKARLRAKGIPVLAISPRRLGVRLADFNRFLAACEI